MLPQEIIKKVKRIQLKMLHLSNDVMSGHYISAFKGTGIEFDEVREYVPGDDIRSIDWNVTARSRTPYIKRFTEERELTLILIVDLSASQRFGTVNALKSELAAEISALLAFLAIKNNDKVGLLIFSDTCERYVPPNKGRRHVLRVIREILAYQPTGTGTNINEALTFIHKVINHRSIIFLISDFMNVDFERSLKGLARRHDLVAVSLSDPKEKELPAIGLVEFRDAETGSRTLLDTSLPQVRAAFKQKALERANATERIFKRNKVDLIDIRTDESYLQPLQKFFLKRERRIR